MLSSIKNAVLDKTFGFRSWKSKRRFIVIDSDDWGMTRMQSKKAFDYFKSLGYPVSENPYCSFDGLETEDDLNDLFGVLSEFKDAKGNPPVISANAVMANPDYQKIKEADFREYHYITIDDSFKLNENAENNLSLYKKGIEEKLFSFEFHGREHINVLNWLKALRENDTMARSAFEFEMASFHYLPHYYCSAKFLDSFGSDDKASFDFQKTSIIEGLDIFKKLIGKEATSFIAPCYRWHPELISTLANKNIKYLLGEKIQIIPNSNNRKKYSRKFHYTGQEEGKEQMYLIRNAHFEPSIESNDVVGSCLKEIEHSFKQNIPAIISSHRLNFMSRINQQNKEDGLKKLKSLLSGILKNWPEVEFVSTAELGEIISKERA